MYLLLTEFDCPEVALCGWWNVDIQLLTHLWFHCSFLFQWSTPLSCLLFHCWSLFWCDYSSDVITLLMISEAVLSSVSMFVSFLIINTTNLSSVSLLIPLIVNEAVCLLFHCPSWSCSLFCFTVHPSYSQWNCLSSVSLSILKLFSLLFHCPSLFTILSSVSSADQQAEWTAPTIWPQSPARHRAWS